VDKLSISLDEALAQVVRDAAAEENLSVSAWLAAAAQDRIRNRLLRLALDADALEFGAMPNDEIESIVAAARANAIVTDPRSDAA
jgi:hypothetical protein